MIKWVWIFLLLFIVSLASVYIFIPAKLSVSESELINCTASGASRLMQDENKWAEWWPGQNSKDPDSTLKMKNFTYNGYSYQLTKFFYNRILVLTQKDKTEINTFLNILPVSKDTIITQWQCTFPSTFNPLKKIWQYQQAKRIKKNMADILSSLRSFLENRSNIYGMEIKEIISTDSTLIAIKKVTSMYPETMEIYDLIKTLKKHIAAHNAKATNYPMLNIKELTNTQFETMVAIPINKRLEGDGAIFPSRFVPWKTLTGEVKGGVGITRQAMDQMRRYIEDYNRTSMGIPFESLITDRSLEQDTLKWISKICQAVS